MEKGTQALIRYSTVRTMSRRRSCACPAPTMAHDACRFRPKRHVTVIVSTTSLPDNLTSSLFLLPPASALFPLLLFFPFLFFPLSTQTCLFSTCLQPHPFQPASPKPPSSAYRYPDSCTTSHPSIRSRSCHSQLAAQKLRHRIEITWYNGRRFSSH